jgi:hypothetical protein
MALCSKAEATTKQSAYEIEYSPLYLYSAASKIRGFVTGRMLGVDHIATLQAEMLPFLNIYEPFSDRIVADYLYRTAPRQYLFSTIRDTFGYRRIPDNCSTYD